MLEKAFEGFEFNDNNVNIIKEIKGLEIPADYYEFMVKHNGNGGEGNFAKNSYI